MSETSAYERALFEVPEIDAPTEGKDHDLEGPPLDAADKHPEGIDSETDRTAEGEA